MNPLISSGDAKITSARSPIMPASTMAGAPFAADIGFEPQVPLPKIADLSVGRGELVGVDFFLTGCGIQSLYLWGFCNGLRLFFFGHSQDCFLLTCQE